MISANEARLEMDNLSSLEERQQLEKVDESIKRNILNGETCFCGKLNNNVITKLKELGYSVEFYSSPRDGSTTTIKW